MQRRRPHAPYTARAAGAQRALSMIVWLCAWAAACDRADAPQAPDAGGDAGADAGEADGGAGMDAPYLTALASAEHYAELAGEGAEVKYLLAQGGDAFGAEPPLDADCIFQNTRRFPFHVQFLQQFPAYEQLDYDSYLALVLRRETRVWWGGGLKLWGNAVHPSTGRAGVISFSVYQEGGGSENLAASELAAVHARLSSCVPYAEDLLVFVPDGAAQFAHVRAIAGELERAGVPVLEPSALRPGLGAEVYTEGEAYGHLRIVPEGAALEDYGPKDVVIATSAPNDVSLLSGLITAHPQSLHSHVNLRLREKSIPNASAPDIYDNQLVQSLAGELVHLRARGSSVEIAPARLEDAQAFWARTRPMLAPLAADLEVEALAAFDALGAADAAAYGVKAANLAELNAILPSQHRAEGFALPLHAYAQFMADNGLDAMVEDLLQDPEVMRDAAHRSRRLRALRDAIRAASTDPPLIERVRALAAQVFGDAAERLRLRFRSSTNAEDLDALSGAGLYESKSGCLADDLDTDATGPSHCLTQQDAAHYQGQLESARAELAAHPGRIWLAARIDDLEAELSEEKGAAAAIRKVWASLWTERAFEERAYYRMDHRAVFMGIAVNASFTREQLDAVAVTALETPSGASLYRVVTQIAEVGVVQPDDPSAVPETLVFVRGENDVISELQVLVASSFSPDGDSLWSPAQVQTLGGLLFQIHDHFAREVHPGVDALSLDMEIKLTHDDRIVVKQARPYARVPDGP